MPGFMLPALSTLSLPFACFFALQHALAVHDKNTLFAHVGVTPGVIVNRLCRIGLTAIFIMSVSMDEFALDLPRHAQDYSFLLASSSAATIDQSRFIPAFNARFDRELSQRPAVSFLNGCKASNSFQ
ncbi:hypothetical protein [Klebsiella quasipneumoniae]